MVLNVVVFVTKTSTTLAETPNYDPKKICRVSASELVHIFQLSNEGVLAGIGCLERCVLQ
jgi:hypothetical protein